MDRFIVKKAKTAVHSDINDSDHSSSNNVEEKDSHDDSESNSKSVKGFKGLNIISQSFCKIFLLSISFQQYIISILLKSYYIQ